jgi:uncharacterized protein with von Willebrand factor type A (vWA) domain
MALHEAGLPVGPDRLERFARAVTLVEPRSTAELYRYALATLVSDPAQADVLAAVFGMVFGGLIDPADQRGDPNAPTIPGLPGDTAATTPVLADNAAGPSPGAAGGRPEAADGPPGRARPDTVVPLRAIATGTERLAGRDFAELSAAELAALADMMRQLTLATPLRPARRYRSGPRGHRIDLRTTLRQARRTAGDPVRLARRERRLVPRRLVVLCDISGSMEPYARAMIQLLYCAANTGPRTEVFTFATRLTRITRALAGPSPAEALRQAGRAAPDWSGGTRIGAAVKEFVDRYGRIGMARGAVVLIISDGWETGDPAELGRQLLRLSRLAHRIVWANPRTQSERYRPLVGGMAAAWPYCDAVVSAHRLSAVPDLAAALAGTARRS